MQNYFPFETKDEWEKLVETAFSPDVPEPEFSARYLRRRRKMIAAATERRKHMKKPTMIVLAGVLSAAILTPSIAVAANYAYQAWQQRTSPHQNTIQIDAGSSLADSDQIAALSYGWLPDGLTLCDDGKYRSETGDMAMTPFFYKLSAENATLSTLVDYAVDQQTYTTQSGNTVLYVQRDTGSDEVWVAFTDTLYVAQLYVSGMTEEEVGQIAEHLALVPAEEETAADWEEIQRIEGEPDNSPSVFEEPVFDAAQLSLCQVGDTVYMLDDETGQASGIAMTIDSATLQADFAGLTGDIFQPDADYSAYLDENGRITTTVSQVLRGDGVDTLDQVLSQETIQQQVLVVDLTLTNTGDTAASQTIFMEAFSMDGNRVVRSSDSQETDEGIVDTVYDKTGELMAEDTAFHLAIDGTHEKNTVTLAPGETAHVQMAYCLDPAVLGNLYLNLDGGGYWPAACIDMGKPILDLCDLS